MKKIMYAVLLAFLLGLAAPAFAWDSKVTGCEVVGVATSPWDGQYKIICKYGDSIYYHFKVAADNTELNKLLAMAMSGMAISHTCTVYYTANGKVLEDIEIMKK